MTIFIHPAKEEITLTGVLNAIGDPVRLNIIKSMVKNNGCMSCSKASPCSSIPKSTLSHHFRVLRESGLIRTVKQGVEHKNTIRSDDINQRFPGLLKLIIELSEYETASSK